MGMPRRFLLDPLHQPAAGTLAEHDALQRELAAQRAHAVDSARQSLPREQSGATLALVQILGPRPVRRPRRPLDLCARTPIA